MPQNASLNGDGFRFYKWEPEDGSPATEVMSVTSIRKLCGEPFRLVAWQLANIADAALGTQKRVVVGPRGGISEKRIIEEYPCEFAQKYVEAAGTQKSIDSLRSWLRDQANQPRDIAAVRGTLVHWCIEQGIKPEAVDKDFVEAVKGTLRVEDQKKMKVVGDEDVSFIMNAVTRYWEMREALPFVLIAREVQIWNLTAGYAGSADALVWFPPEGTDLASLKPASEITWEYIQSIGGEVAVLDWKTATDIHTENVVQVTAYICGEFVGTDGVIDQRLTEILQGATAGGIIHIRPNKWGVYRFTLEDEVVRAFLGSVAFARFLGKYQEPEKLFNLTLISSKEEVA